jgi:cyanophycinase
MAQMKNKKIKTLFTLLTLVLLNSFLVSAQNTSVGPGKGWLILHGGSKKREWEAERRFASLAGGPNASIVVVLTPIDLEVLTPEFLQHYKQWWASEFGVSKVTFLDTRDRKEAETETFVAPLRQATGVWITGGHNNNLVDVYVGTRTEREIGAVAERGGVIAGSSAGAMIQGSFLISRSLTAKGGTSFANLDRQRLVGFGFLKEVMVYPHLGQRHAEKMMLEVLAHYPDLLGIGLDENTAIVVHEDQFEVIGEGRVGIFEGKNRAANKYLILTKGQKFDLRKRSALD